MLCMWFFLVLLIQRASSIEATVPPEKVFHHTDKHTGNFGVRPGGKHAANDKRRQGGTLPTIFIIGIQKGGSSSLYELMIEHPLLCSGLHKEMHYFDHPDNYAKGTDFYRQMFSDPKCDSRNQSQYIDSTPVLHYPSVWQRIYDTYSYSVEMRDNLKFIVLLREPVAREYSWYQHTARTDMNYGQTFVNVKTLNETFDGNATFFRKGRYLEQLQSFVKVFQRKQLFVLSSAEMFKNTKNIMELIRQFIDVPDDPIFQKALPHDDHLGLMSKQGTAECITAHVPALDCWVRDAMGEYFEPHNAALYAWMNSTRPIAAPMEPIFSPLFNDYKLNPCVSDARAEINKLIQVDLESTPPKTKC